MSAEESRSQGAIYIGAKSYPSPHIVLCANGLRPITHSNCCSGVDRVVRGQSHGFGGVWDDLHWKVGAPPEQEVLLLGVGEYDDPVGFAHRPVGHLGEPLGKRAVGDLFPGG